MMEVRLFILFVITCNFNLSTYAGGLDGLGMREGIMAHVIWFLISMVLFFIARSNMRKKNDSSSFNLMMLSAISLVIFFGYGAIRMYIEHGARVIPGSSSFRIEPESISFIFRIVLAIVFSFVTLSVYNKYKGKSS